MAAGFYKTLTHVDGISGLAVPIVLASDTSLRTVANGGKVEDASGFDIRFFSDAALLVPLDHTMISYVATTGALTAWVQLDATSAASGTVYMGFGDVLITTDQSTTATFSVYGTESDDFWLHLEEDPTGGGTIDAVDAGPNTNTFVANANTATTHTQEVGVVSNGIKHTTVSGASESYDHPAASQTISDQDFTVSLWAKGHAANRHPGDKWMLDCQNSGTGRYQFAFQYDYNAAIQGTTEIFAAWHDGGGVQRTLSFGVDPFLDSAWHMYTMRYDLSTAEVHIYLDGVLVGTDSTNGDIDTGASLFFMSLGRGIADSGFGRYTFDELRLTGTELDVSWILAEYNSQVDPTVAPANFWTTLGAETATAPPPVVIEMDSVLELLLDIDSSNLELAENDMVLTVLNDFDATIELG